MLKTLVVVLSLLCMSFTNFMNSGVHKYGKVSLDSIQNNGMLFLDGTKVAGKVQVNGKFEAKKASMGSLQANGTTILENCLISKKAVINGYLKAKNTEIKGELSIATHKVTLRHCEVGSIFVRKTDDRIVQVVELLENTRINGSVVFEQGFGKIILSQDSTIAQNPAEEVEIFRN